MILTAAFDGQQAFELACPGEREADANSEASAEATTTTTAAVAAAAAAVTFDVILMDCNMPVMDGLETARQIRAHEAKMNSNATSHAPRHTPIIGHTANARLVYRQECLSSGMDDLVCKPCSREELLGKLAQYADETATGVVFEASRTSRRREAKDIGSVTQR